MKLFILAAIFASGCAGSSLVVQEQAEPTTQVEEAQTEVRLPDRFTLFATMSTQAQISTVCQIVLDFERVGDVFHVVSAEDHPMPETEQVDVFNEGYFRLLCQMPSFKIHAKTFAVSDVKPFAGETEAEIRRKFRHYFEKISDPDPEKIAEERMAFVLMRIESSLSVFTRLVFPRPGEAGKPEGDYPLGNGESCSLSRTIQREHATDFEQIKTINILAQQAGVAPVHDEVVYEKEDAYCYSSKLNLNVIASSRAAVVKPPLKMDTIWDVQIERIHLTR